MTQPPDFITPLIQYIKWCFADSPWYIRLPFQAICGAYVGLTLAVLWTILTM